MIIPFTKRRFPSFPSNSPQAPPSTPIYQQGVDSPSLIPWSGQPYPWPPSYFSSPHPYTFLRASWGPLWPPTSSASLVGVLPSPSQGYQHSELFSHTTFPNPSSTFSFPLPLPLIWWSTYDRELISTRDPYSTSGDIPHISHKNHEPLQSICSITQVPPLLSQYPTSICHFIASVSGVM